MKSFLRFTALFALLTTFSVQLKAQDVEEILNESIDDAEKLIGPYIAPLMNTVSASLNQGWYNTAKPHKIAGIDFTITVNMMGIPADQLQYKPNDLGMENLRLAGESPNYPYAPTIFGKEDEPVYEIEGDPSGEATVFGPPGIDLKENTGFSRVPVPMAQLGIGLPKGTDLKFRFVPKMELGDGVTVNMLGIGIMHDIKQWIPGIKELPFDLSGFVGHTTFKIDAAFDDADNMKNAGAGLKMSATTIQGVISKKVSVLTVYGGLGYNITKSSINVGGEFDVDDNGSFDDKNFNLDFAASGPRLSAGLRLKLAIFTFHGEYTLQKYSCLTAGFGLSIR